MEPLKKHSGKKWTLIFDFSSKFEELSDYDIDFHSIRSLKPAPELIDA